MELIARMYMRTSKDNVKYVRIITPKELRGYVTKPAIWRSLKTNDRSEALESVAALTVATRELMQEIAEESISTLSPVVIIPDEINANDFSQFLEKVEREDVETLKTDLKKSFSNEVKKPKKKEVKAKENAPKSRRRKIFEHRRKSRKFGRNLQRRN
jgi:hypothetical protein